MINREYIKNVIHDITKEKSILTGCKKIQELYGIPYYIIYNFTRNSLPGEYNLLKIIKSLNLDLSQLFLL